MLPAALVISLLFLLLPREIDAFSTTAVGSECWWRGDDDRCFSCLLLHHHSRVRAAFRDATARSRVVQAATESNPPGIRRRFPIRNHPSLVLLSALNRGSGTGESDNNSGDSANDNPKQADDTAGGIDLALDPRLYRVRLPRTMGIDWKTDLSFRWVSVRGMDPTGAASLSGAIKVGDQLCELTPVTSNKAAGRASRAPRPISLLGAPFDEVMQAFADLDRSVADVDLVFFRGTNEELKAACTGVEREPDTVTVTVIQNKGAKDEAVRTLTAPAGANLRELLVGNGVNVYRSVTRWTNCKGKQLCGTCIVDVSDGSINTNRKSMDETSTLRENPDSYRLSCVTFAYGDVTVETFPPVNAAQWTR